MEELFDVALAYPRFRTQVIGLFAGVAAVLAAVGIFSVLAYLVGQRTRELAVRRALGARAADVIRLIVGQGLRLVAIGLVLGLAGALAVARLLTGLLYEISPWDVGTYLGTIAVLGSAAAARHPPSRDQSRHDRARRRAPARVAGVFVDALTVSMCDAAIDEEHRVRVDLFQTLVWRPRNNWAFGHRCIPAGCALFLPQICPIFSVVTPCRPGASGALGAPVISWTPH